MLKMGIPKEAVKNKCLLDGLDPSFMDKSSNQTSSNSLPNRKLLLNDLTISLHTSITISVLVFCLNKQ